MRIRVGSGSGLVLARLDGCIVELLDPGRTRANDVIMVPALIEIKY